MRLIPVPWIRWQRYRFDGVVRTREDRDLIVCALDEDVVKDDFLGEAATDAAGASASSSATPTSGTSSSRPRTSPCACSHRARASRW